MSSRVLVLFGSIFCAGTAVATDFVPVAQDRFLSTEARVTVEGGDGDFDNDFSSAADFSPYLDTVQSTAFFGTQLSSAIAQQDSSMSAALISAQGSVGAGGDVGPANIAAQGLSFFSYTFTVDAPVDYLLSGLLQGSDALAYSEFILYETGSGTSIYDQSLASGAMPLSSSGNLAAGTYSVVASSFIENVDGGTQSASYDFTLTIPEPGSLSLLLLSGMTALLARGRRD